MLASRPARSHQARGGRCRLNTSDVRARGQRVRDDRGLAGGHGTWRNFFSQVISPPPLCRPRPGTRDDNGPGPSIQGASWPFLAQHGPAQPAGQCEFCSFALGNQKRNYPGLRRTAMRPRQTRLELGVPTLARLARFATEGGPRRGNTPALLLIQPEPSAPGPPGPPARRAPLP